MISSLNTLIKKGRARKQEKGVFYRNSLVYILLAASIPGFMIGLLVYHFATHQLKDDISDLHYQQMNERVKNIDDQFSYLEMGLSNWVFNPTFGYRLERAIDEDGNVYGVCRGSGFAHHAYYYKYELMPRLNDTHGIGIIMLAGIEAGKMNSWVEMQRSNQEVST